MHEKGNTDLLLKRFPFLLAVTPCSSTQLPAPVEYVETVRLSGVLGLKIQGSGFRQRQYEEGDIENIAARGEGNSWRGGAFPARWAAKVPEILPPTLETLGEKIEETLCLVIATIDGGGSSSSLTVGDRAPPDVRMVGLPGGFSTAPETSDLESICCVQVQRDEGHILAAALMACWDQARKLGKNQFVRLSTRWLNTAAAPPRSPSSASVLSHTRRGVSSRLGGPRNPVFTRSEMGAPSLLQGHYSSWRELELEGRAIMRPGENAGLCGHRARWNGISEALALYDSTTKQIEPGTWKSWKKRCRSDQPLQAEFVAVVTSDFTTSTSAIHKRIRRLGRTNNSGLPSPTASPPVSSSSAPSTDKRCMPPLAKHAGPKSPESPKLVEVSTTGTQDGELVLYAVGGGGTRERSNGTVAVQVRVTLNEEMIVVGSRQLESSHSLPTSLLSVGLVPGVPLKNSIISLRSHWWSFQDTTKFTFSSDGETTGTQFAIGLSSSPDPDGESGADTGVGRWEPVLFNFPFGGFEVGGPLYGVTLSIAKTVAQHLPLTFKSTVLNEILLRAGKSLSPHPYAVEALEVVFSFENVPAWGHGQPKLGLEVGVPHPFKPSLAKTDGNPTSSHQVSTSHTAVASTDGLFLLETAFVPGCGKSDVHISHNFKAGSSKLGERSQPISPRPFRVAVPSPPLTPRGNRRAPTASQSLNAAAVRSISQLLSATSPHSSPRSDRSPPPSKTSRPRFTPYPWGALGGAALRSLELSPPNSKAAVSVQPRPFTEPNRCSAKSMARGDRAGDGAATNKDRGSAIEIYPIWNKRRASPSIK
ncbi:hypothetical protein FA13DRAFT_1716664 [Coprinellus micaceus]|uniref:Uncharacterized protein n=1 Tax=Coprinellus micaceus TaxID=71717 RepID=A0A4Y7SII2_COPMI|nr:hypothetical protein FA13DRAFT_1716664 [Coprinellus micaceus]